MANKLFKISMLLMVFSTALGFGLTSGGEVNTLSMPTKETVSYATSEDLNNHDTNHSSDYNWKAFSTSSYENGITGGDTLDTMSYYYLDENIVLTKTLTIRSYITLCLNGKYIDGNSNGSVISVSSNAYFNLCDCSGNDSGAIKGGKASYYGGGVYVNSAAIFNMYGGSISNNSITSDEGFGAGLYVNGTFNMYDGSISNNTHADYGDGLGAGLYVNGTFNMYDGSISNNTARFGGGVGVSGIFNMYDGSIFENAATIAGGYGGGVYVSGSNATLNMYDGSISNNEADYGGGVCAENSGTIYIYDGSISNNEAGSGGGMYVGYNSGTINMYGGLISSNTVRARGGGVYMDHTNGKLNIFAGYFDNDISIGAGTASVKGGYFSSTAYDSIKNYIADGYIAKATGDSNWPYVVVDLDTYINDHTHNDWTLLSDSSGSTLEGGNSQSGMKYYYLNEDIKLLSSDITISGYVTLCLNGYMLTGTNTSSVITIPSGAYLNLCDCIGNEQNNEYAHNYYVNNNGIYVFQDCETDCQDTAHSDHGTIYGGVITGGNVSSGSGGAISVGSNGELYMYSGTLAGNYAYYDGGGVNVSGTFYMYDGTICGNYAGSQGGGVKAYNAENFYINGGTISDNTAYLGGGVHMYGGSFNIYDGTISNNIAGSGGGVYVVVSSFNINGGTISDNNTTTYSGGGVFVQNSTVNMYGGAITDNTAGNNYGDGVYLTNNSTAYMYGGYLNNDVYSSSTNIYIKGGYFNLTAYNKIKDYVDSDYIGIDISTLGVDFDKNYIDECPYAVYANSATSYSVDNVDGLTYGGSSYTPTINNILGTDYTSVAYTYKDIDDNEVSGLPSDAGEYTVTAHFLYTTVEGYITTNSYGTTEFSVSISKGQAEISASSYQSKVYDGNVASIAYKAIVGNFDITNLANITWYNEEGVIIEAPTEVGTYNVMITISGTDNYYGKSVFVKYTITENTSSSTPSDGEDTTSGDTTTTNDDDSGLSAGVIAGIVIGSIFVVGAVALLVYFLFFRRRKEKGNK